MTEQELEQYLEKLDKGCEWYNAHPECFKLIDNGFDIEIINEDIPEEAKIYVNFIHNRYEANKKKKELLAEMGIGGKIPTNPRPRNKIKWG